MNRTRAALIVTIVAVIAGASCSAGQDTKAAEVAVEKFHSQFNQEQNHQIYLEASEDFRKASTEKELTDLLTAIRQKIGAFKEAKSAGWHVNYSTERTAVTLTYESTFERGKATEQFIYTIEGDQAKLLRYDINSNDLKAK